jgi:hypothetical protein
VIGSGRNWQAFQLADVKMLDLLSNKSYSDIKNAAPEQRQKVIARDCVTVRSLPLFLFSPELPPYLPLKPDAQKHREFPYRLAPP